MTGLSIAVVGLGFGQDFVPIYLAHPTVDRVVLVEPNAQHLAEVAARFAIPEADARADIADVLDDPTIDAVHILAPVFLHADLAVRVLEAGKHCACAVPMATTLEDIDRIRAAVQASGRRYMMMETTVFAREFFEVRAMHERGELGDLTLYRGFHIQNLDGFPSYWQGYPPMHYLTHALSPALALVDSRVTRVSARGAGVLTGEQTSGGFDNRFPTEVGLFELEGTPLIANITMSFFNTARAYVEGFALYGSQRGVEWPEDNEGPLTVHDMGAPAPGSRGNSIRTRTVAPRDPVELLPEPLRAFVDWNEVQLPGMPAPVRVNAYHGGSHPYLVHEFVSALTEDRAPSVDETRAAEWTAPGIVAHDSAMRDGVWLEVPSYR